MFDSNDIVLLTETWSNCYHDLNVSNFECFVLHRKEQFRTTTRSSGGIAVYIRNTYVTEDTLVFKSEDDIICIKVDGTFLGLTNDLYMCLCYVVPENSSRQALIESHTFDRVLDFYTSLYSKYGSTLNFVLCGDFNSHTSDLPDFVKHDNFTNCNVLPDDYVIDEDMQRASQDSGRTNIYRKYGGFFCIYHII